MKWACTHQRCHFRYWTAGSVHWDDYSRLLLHFKEKKQSLWSYFAQKVLICCFKPFSSLWCAPTPLTSLKTLSPPNYLIKVQKIRHFALIFFHYQRAIEHTELIISCFLKQGVSSLYFSSHTWQVSFISVIILNSFSFLKYHLQHRREERGGGGRRVFWCSWLLIQYYSTYKYIKFSLES